MTTGRSRSLRQVGYDALVEYERARPNRPGRDSVVGRAALTGRVAHIPDVLADPEYALRDVQEQFGFRTLLAVPITREGQHHRRGRLRPQRGPPVQRGGDPPRDLVRRPAGIAIENVRLLQTIERQKRSSRGSCRRRWPRWSRRADGERLLAGHRREVTAVFCDLRGYTAFAESAEPEELLGVLRDYHAAMGDLIVEHDGTLEHYAGDGMHHLLQRPGPSADHA